MRTTNIAILVSGFYAWAGMAIAQAQTPPDSPAAGQAPAAAPAPKSPLTQWGTNFSFLFDGYVDGNFNSPASGFNGLRAFDVRSNTAHVNMGMITIDRAPAPLGFHLDAGFGQTFELLNNLGNRDPDSWKYFQQAYVSVKPKSWGGAEIDLGKFATSAGAEVIDVNQNWNYSRSLLFAWAAPSWHFGARVSFPVGPHFTGSVQVLNGCNNVEPVNSGKTIGITGAYAWKKVTWSNNYYVGPEHPHTTRGWRNSYDTFVQVNPSDNLSYYINFDYLRDKYVGPGAGQVVGLAGAARYAFPKTKFALAGRLEWLDDVDGFSTGTAQNLAEFTVTGEYKMTSWLITRVEVRSDFSSRPFFEKSRPGGSQTQPTVLLGLIAYLAPTK